MSLDMASERVCYVHCNFCNTILAVSVPCNNMLTIVTVRCGHCANLLSVNMGALLQTIPLQDLPQKQQSSSEFGSKDSGGSSSKGIKFGAFGSAELEPPRMPPIRPPEKRQRVPSAYNRFIKKRPLLWAHFPHIHFGLKLDGNKKAKLDQSFAANGTPDQEDSGSANFY
ncbi:hypothetical protein RHGRI_002128 [Rhododendron griersonianum]|uniref:Uncharacterized protein n=1 Tax=Rhododendron griersonianum TaxID=479676 RepID=A0AAV6LNA8_9ERIC|nr:hypothetical protein RHGRI_002128 [Rhododendron griersonianum]